MKEVTMRRKSRLKGRRVFIENDLSWEERKLQERIYRQVKEEREREKGKYIKIGYAGVKIDGKWKNWGEIEKEMIRKGNIEVGREGEKETEARGEGERQRESR